MKLSIITTFTATRQDPWKEALACYSDLADEVIVVYDFAEQEITDFIKDNPKIKGYHMDWPFEYDWSEFPKHYNYALEKATGDWIIKLDIDLFIHEDDHSKLRELLFSSNAIVASLHKNSVYGRNYFSKGDVVNCLNIGQFKKLRFGGVSGHDGRDDLVGIILPTEERNGVLYGFPPDNVFKTSINFWNFDYAFKDETTAHRDFARMARAYKRFFNSDDFGKDDLDAIEIYENQKAERIRRATYPVEPGMIPKYIREKYIQGRLTDK